MAQAKLPAWRYTVKRDGATVASGMLRASSELAAKRAARSRAIAREPRLRGQRLSVSANRASGGTLKRNRPIPRSSKRALGALFGAALGSAAAGQFYCRRGSGYVLGTAASTGVGMVAALVGAVVGDRLAR